LRTIALKQLLHHTIAGLNPFFIGKVGIGQHHHANFLLWNKRNISAKTIGCTRFIKKVAGSASFGCLIGITA
jgi:hypothetical protein